MKKVLFIYYHFPPMMGDWRGLGFAKFLPEFGWQPIVISADENVNYKKDYSLLREVPDEIEVHRVGHRETSKEWIYVRKKLRLNYVFPDEYKSWYLPVLKEARRILRKEKIELIFTSSSPFTTAFIGMKLKKEFNIPWIAEFRDTWSGNDFLNLGYGRTLLKPLRKFLNFRIKRGENSILKAADRTIVLSWHHKQQLCELYGVKDEKIRVVTNGYNKSDFIELRPRILYPSKLTIVFIGSSYPGYQEVALKFAKTVNEIDKDAEVMFIGRGAAAIQDINIPNLTCILHLQKKKALALASGSDFFFLITLPSAKWHLPIKLYDYLRLGKPILALVPEDGDAAKIIKEAKAGFIISYEHDKMKEQLKNIFDKWKKAEFKDFQPDWKYITQFERIELTKKLVSIFDEVADRNSSR